MSNGPKHCAGLMAYSYWMSFIGNVSAHRKHGRLGLRKTRLGGKPGIWMLGWDGSGRYPIDAKVSATTLRHGNFDYLTNDINRDEAIADHACRNPFT